MARPRKQTVDYFPHYCNHGKTMYILEQKYGNDGYAFWFKLLEMLGSTEGHYLDVRNFANLEFLAAKTHMETDKCKEILNLLANLEAIDKDLWEENIVWSNNFLDNIKDAYRNRAIETPSYPSFLRKKPQLTEVNSDNQRKKSTNEMKEDDMKEDTTSQTKFDDTHPAKIYAVQLKEWIYKNDPKYKKTTPGQLERWAEEIDRAYRIDNRGWEEIEQVIDFSQKDVFWWKNIRSGEKLRKHFDRLTAEMISKGYKKNKEEETDMWM